VEISTTDLIVRYKIIRDRCWWL